VTLVAAVLAVATIAPAGAAANPSDQIAGALNFPWPDLLPALPTASNPQPGPVPGCSDPTPACIDREIQRMTQLQDSWGCDHRAVFATTYLELTKTLRGIVARDPHFFSDPQYLYYEDALFAEYYFRAVERDAAGQPVPEAWRIAFDTAASGDANAGQDMLLGINAHVQRDMPFVLAELGLHRPDGSSRKGDHDRVNDVLQRGYERVVAAVARRYDPLLYTTNARWNPVDNVAGLELVKSWREGAWRNAERLLNATTEAERQRVAQSIEDNAAGWARMMAAPQIPGYRARRDSYCAAQRASARRSAHHRRARRSRTRRRG
jgi:hypothetical protein